MIENLSCVYIKKLEILYWKVGMNINFRELKMYNFIIILIYNFINFEKIK